VVPTVAASVDLVVHLTRDRHGRRQVTEIVGVPGRIEGDVVEIADLFARLGDRLVRADGWPPHPERFAAVGVDLTELLRPGLTSARADAVTA
jgi:pilus assembly protein CpaF